MKNFLGWLVLLVFLISGCGQNTPHPKAQNGVIDLGSWNSTQGPVKLEGDWQFAFNRLLKPDAPQWKKNKGVIHLPGLWQGQRVNNIPLTPKGYGTYRLKILNLPQNFGPAALHLPDILSVGKVWVNGNPIAASGTVGTDKTTEDPGTHTLISTFPIEGSTLDILIQVSNFHNAQGGINMPIWFGSARAVQKEVAQEWIITAVMGSVLLLISFSHIILISIGKTEKAHVWFGLYCLVWAVQIIFSAGNGCLGAFLFKWLPWRSSIDLTLGAYALSPPLMIMFYHALFPNSWSRRINLAFQIVAGGFLVYLILTPPNAYDPVCFVYSFAALGGGIYLFVRFFLDVIKKKPGVGTLIPGFLLLIFTLVNDILKDLHLVNNEFIFSYGLFGFVLSYSFFISLRLSKTFAAVREMSLTLEKRNKELSKLDRLKDQLLANTSHELKTPLNGILGMAQSFADLSLPVNVSRGLVIIEASARRLLSLINDLLDLSQLKNKDLGLEVSAVNLSPVVDSVLMVMSQFIKDQPICFENHIPENFPALMCDEDRLHQILFNLVGNSIKFTKQGKISIRASVHNKNARISVRDTGTGIARKNQEKIFLAFEQGDQIPDRTHRGSGLGLAITRDLVQLNQGKIGVDSQEGNGATFWFTIPLWPEGKPPIYAQPSPLEKRTMKGFPDPDVLAGHMIHQTETDKDKALILTVDDDPINLQVVANHLMGNNMGVETFSNGEQVLKRLETDPLPNLILLDVMMPGISGYEVCNRIRHTYSPSELPIILLTAKHQIQDLIQGFSSGANDYLTKPFEKKELMARIKTQLRFRQAYHALKENVFLKKELQAQKTRERTLKLTQITLSGLLNTVKDAVIAVNPAKEIGFSNKAFETSTGLNTETLLGQSFLALFQDKNDPAMTSLVQCMESSDPSSISLEHTGLVVLGKNNTRVTVDITLRRMPIDGEDFCLMLFKKQGKAPNDRSTSLDQATRFIDTLNLNRERLLKLEIMLQGMAGNVWEERSDIHKGIIAIDRILDEMGRTQENVQPKAAKRKEQIVGLINLAVDYWELQTGTTRVELAEQSSLWNVYIGKDGWARTQTLDKYLSISTLPVRPRWKNVVNTAHFVLAACNDEDSPIRQKLETALKQFGQ